MPCFRVTFYWRLNNLLLSSSLTAVPSQLNVRPATFLFTSEFSNLFRAGKQRASLQSLIEDKHTIDGIKTGN